MEIPRQGTTRIGKAERGADSYPLTVTALRVGSRKRLPGTKKMGVLQFAGILIQ